MQLKVGDKLYCYKTRLHSKWGHSIKEGDICEVSLIKTSIINNIEFTSVSVEGVAFSYGVPEKYSRHYNNLEDHFYTEKELRKLKLDEIQSR